MTGERERPLPVMKFHTAAAIIALPYSSLSAAASSKTSKKAPTPPPTTPKAGKYEVWGSDQSNSVPGQTSKGVNGSLLWIWDSDSIQDQLGGGVAATPLTCSPDKAAGPCDLLTIFPQDLVESGSGALLGNLSQFGRLHGTIPDPSTRYVTANIFAPGGGYVGIIDTVTKEAVGLFRVTQTSATGPQRSVHMSFWSADGLHIIIDNLHGKMIERIDVTRDNKGKITKLVFNANAGVYLGGSFNKIADATSFSGLNAFGNNLTGSVSGDYSLAGKFTWYELWYCQLRKSALTSFFISKLYHPLLDTGDLTPAGKKKEWNCIDVIPESQKPQGGCRPNNVPICPITSSGGYAYVTLGGGGLFVLKTSKYILRAFLPS